MFLYSSWMSLPINTRHKIAREFGIIKRGSTEVVDNHVKSDVFVIEISNLPWIASHSNSLASLCNE